MCLCVCVYVCMCVCVCMRYVCMWACVYVYICVCVWLLLSDLLQAWIPTWWFRALSSERVLVSECETHFWGEFL